MSVLVTNKKSLFVMGECDRFEKKERACCSKTFTFLIPHLLCVCSNFIVIIRLYPHSRAHKYRRLEAATIDVVHRFVFP